MISQTQNRVPALSQDTISSLVLNGDLSKLTAPQKVEYYNAMCDRIGLDPATQPFKLLELQGKQILYADKGAAQQLCKIYNISTEVLKKERFEDLYIVTVRAKMPVEGGDRFTDEDGAVSITEPEKIKVNGQWKDNPKANQLLRGDALANALMKAVTKAKRRAVLALCGLGMLDETEIETIKGATTAEFNAAPVEKTPDFIKDIEASFPQVTDEQIAELRAIAKTKFSSALECNVWLAKEFAFENIPNVLKDSFESVKAKMSALPNNLNGAK